MELLLSEPHGTGELLLSALSFLFCFAFAAFCLYKVTRLVRLAAKATPSEWLRWRFIVVAGFWFGLGAAFVWLIWRNLAVPEATKVVLQGDAMKIEHRYWHQDVVVSREQIDGAEYRDTFVGLLRRERTRRPSIIVRLRTGEKITLESQEPGREVVSRWQDTAAQIDQWASRAATRPVLMGIRHQ